MGYSGSISSKTIGPVLLSPVRGTVSINGDIYADETVSATLAGVSANSNTVTYQWQRSDRVNGPYQTVQSKVRDTTYSLVKADMGKYMRVVANIPGSGPVLSATVGPVGMPRLRGKVTIEGNGPFGIKCPLIGDRLTANTSALDGAGVFSYIWEVAEQKEGPWRLAAVHDTRNPHTYLVNIRENLPGGLYTGPLGGNPPHDNFDVYGDYEKHIRVRVSRSDRSSEIISEPTEKVMELSVTIEQMDYASDNIDGVTSAYIDTTLQARVRWKGTDWTEWHTTSFNGYSRLLVSYEWQVSQNGMDGPWVKAADYFPGWGTRLNNRMTFEVDAKDRGYPGPTYIRVKVTQYFPNSKHPIIRYSPPAGRVKPTHMIGWK
jgi:hypothetical protein